MRSALLSILISVVPSVVLVACHKDPEAKADAAIHIVDAKLIDAAVDAPPDAPPDATPMNIVTACMHACDALGVCIQQPVPQDCYSDCQVDLSDCSTEQVAAVDACSTQDCGDILNGGDSPLINCISAVTCVEMALARPSK
jgi:hypothetical protein